MKESEKRLRGDQASACERITSQQVGSRSEHASKILRRNMRRLQEMNRALHHQIVAARLIGDSRVCFDEMISLSKDITVALMSAKEIAETSRW